MNLLQASLWPQHSLKRIIKKVMKTSLIMQKKLLAVEMTSRWNEVTSLGNGQEGDYLRIHSVLRQTLPTPRHHLLTIIHKIICYVSIHVFKTKVPYPNFKHNIKIYKTMIQLSMIFSIIAFYYECCKWGRKREESEWGGRQL